MRKKSAELLLKDVEIMIPITWAVRKKEDKAGTSSFVSKTPPRIKANPSPADSPMQIDSYVGRIS